LVKAGKVKKYFRTAVLPLSAPLRHYYFKAGQDTGGVTGGTRIVVRRNVNDSKNVPGR